MFKGGETKCENAWAVEQILDRGGTVHARVQRCLHQPGNELGILNRVLIPLGIDAFVLGLVQNTPVDE